jgi:pyruvate/2-oxoglutarate dehydrogenase complex dihydrolipoamide acyltransferase (E2) component
MNKKKKKKIQPQEQPIKEETFCNLKFTIDHRYMDGAQAAKIAGEIEKVINEPETLFS